MLCAPVMNQEIDLTIPGINAGIYHLPSERFDRQLNIERGHAQISLDVSHLYLESYLLWVEVTRNETDPLQIPKNMYIT